MEDVIKIKKHHVKFIESNYGSEYFLIDLPKKSKYEDYSVQVYAGLMSSKDYYYTIKKPWKDEFFFTLIKNTREEGKRYARPKLTWEELKKELDEYNVELDYSNLPVALAKFNEYERDKKGIISYESEILLGKTDGTWFYLESGERRLVSAKHFKLIKNYLNPEEIKGITQKLIRLNKLKLSIESLKKYNYEITHALNERIIDARENQKFDKLCKEFLNEYKKLEQKNIEEHQKILKELEEIQ